MPYIKKRRRHAAYRSPATPGELNFAITKLLTYYVNEWGANYVTYNDILGALEGAKLEFYRRVVVPYEEDKRKEHGDVY